MPVEPDTEMKSANSIGVDVESYRKHVQTYLNLHIYDSALFWADKVVALTSGNPKDVYWLAQCMYSLKQYHRAAHLLRSRNLDKKYVLCNYLTVKCLLEANELMEALKVLNAINMELFLQKPTSTPIILGMEIGMFDSTPKHQVQSSVLLLKGKVLEAMDNRSLASDCYKQALQYDVHCYEAFDSLIKHHMISAAEENQLLNSLPIGQQCSLEEGQILHTLYENKLKKYTTMSSTGEHPTFVPTTNVNITPQTPEQYAMRLNLLNSTPNLSIGAAPYIFTGSFSINAGSTPNTTNNNPKIDLGETAASELGKDLAWERLHGSLDISVSKAERLYYNCDYFGCLKLTEWILEQDPYHSSCLPIHISCLVELKQNNKLFTLAHKLVDLYPNLAIAWYAVGCYYFVIRKPDSARRFLAKATSLDRLFAPAWLAYGHSFAVENEHDQAMAAYFKASQLMKGCHLPLLYIGLECGLTNNVRLAEKFFQEAKNIAPNDPFVIHEMGVIAFQNLEYKTAETYFKEAYNRAKPIKTSFLPDKWEPVLNNLGHTYRKLKMYDEALKYHHEALVLAPQTPGTYAAIAYAHTLKGDLEEAVEWFHKALSLKRDDTFSTTMLNYVIEQLCEEQIPYEGCPDHIPDFVMEKSTDQVDSENNPVTFREISGTEMSLEMDMSDASSSKN